MTTVKQFVSICSIISLMADTKIIHSDTLLALNCEFTNKDLSAPDTSFNLCYKTVKYLVPLFAITLIIGIKYWIK